MNTPLLLITALLVAAHTASAQTRTNAPAPQATAKSVAKPTPAASFEAFKNVPDRNIFNSRRFAGRTGETPPPAPRRDPVVEMFSLLGTLDYPKGSVAFFEGSSPSHRKPVKVDESIAGCKVTAIEPDLVRLETAGKPFELKVGYMLRREDDGEWKMREAERPSDYGSPVSSTSGLGSSHDPRFGSSSGGRDSRGGGSSFGSRDARSGNTPFGSSDSPADLAQRRIREQDRNGDGKISRDEADSRLRDRFRDMDKNSDGQVDAEEYTAYYASRMGGSSSSNPPSNGFNNPASPGSFGSSNNSSSSSTPPPPSAPSVGGTSESEMLRRLMEQRARENR